MPRPTRSLLALAAITLGACADPAAPTARAPEAPALVQSSGDRDALPEIAGAKSNKNEPKHVDQGRFDIQFRYLTAATPAQRATFEGAAARWQRIVIKDVPSVSGVLPTSLCTGGPDFTGTVDDLLIDVVLTPIDGPGNILGAASPCFVRNVDNLPVYGYMIFDVADLALLDKFGLFDEVIVHEMGHVLGIGTLWNYQRTLLAGTAADPRFVGKFANIHFGSAGGDGLLPVESSGGPGTAFAHWRESAFDNELMTGFLNLGENPLSDMTAGSLRDLGYGVGIVGDRYKLPSAALRGAVSLDVEGVQGIDIARSEQLRPARAVVPQER